ncbi:MAG: glycosyltransferase family 4 protein [Candidatus Peribacteraceae bacterium]|nr:glycosyltransferase family 4 protein [Candidatus Peribacteraceae bacterium]
MRIAYCTNVRLPNERAHGHQVARVVNALSVLGHDVSVFAPFRINPVEASFHSYYGLPHAVGFHPLGSFDGIASKLTPGVIGLKVTTALFLGALKKKLLGSDHAFDLLYTRTPQLIGGLLKTGIPLVVELHTIPRWSLGLVRQLKHCTLIVALTSPMRSALIARGVPAEKIIVEGDAVDLVPFASVRSMADVRAQWKLPLDRPLIGYAGQLTSMGLSKGIPELVGALELLTRKRTPFHAVIAGGPDVSKRLFEENVSPTLAPHITFTGFMDHADIPSLLSACDILVYPAPSTDHPFYRRDTSPLKVFEYMAAGKPIVSADLPPLRDILDETVATLVLAGDTRALADGIESVLLHPVAAGAIAAQAKTRVQEHTWIERMRRILSAATLQG